jgi:hypothetical protein
MTSHHPVSPFDPAATFEIDVDLLAVGRSHIIVRDRADGREHVLRYDGVVAIGSNATGDAYTLITPRVLARMKGLCE